MFSLSLWIGSKKILSGSLFLKVANNPVFAETNWWNLTLKKSNFSFFIWDKRFNIATKDVVSFMSNSKNSDNCSSVKINFFLFVSKNFIYSRNLYVWIFVSNINFWLNSSIAWL